jgi:hypothetical protein
MKSSGRLGGTRAVCLATLLAGLVLVSGGAPAAGQAGTAGAGKAAPGTGAGQWDSDSGRPETVCEPSLLDSPYIPVDSWVYPAVLRLYSMGYAE